MFDKQLYKLFFKKLFTLPIRVVFWDQTTEKFGTGAARISLIFHRYIPIKQLQQDGFLAFCSAYMNQDIEVIGPDFALKDLITSVYQNGSLLKEHWHMNKKSAPSVKPTPKRTPDYYTVSQEFDHLWFAEMQTCFNLIFEQPDTTLLQAQTKQNAYLFSKLHFSLGDSLLDIGCGWGDFMLAAAKKYQIKVLGLTQNQQQFEFVRKKIYEQQLEDLATVKMADYRQLETEKHNYIIKTDLFEHWQEHDTALNLQAIAKLLKPNGQAFIQSITCQQVSAKTSSTRQRFLGNIFVPELAELTQHLTKHSFQLAELNTRKNQYQQTLKNRVYYFRNQLNTTNSQDKEAVLRLMDLYLQAYLAFIDVKQYDIQHYLITKCEN